MMWRTLLLSFSLLALFPTLAHAQFGFFEQMFQGHHQQQQQQQQQPSSGSHWAAMADQIACSQYLCPTTLLCVPHPMACPCPSPEDIKCVINDHESFNPKESSGTVVCVRGSHGCDRLEELLRPKW